MFSTEAPLPLLACSAALGASASRCRTGGFWLERAGSKPQALRALLPTEVGNVQPGWVPNACLGRVAQETCGGRPAWCGSARWDPRPRGEKKKGQPLSSGELFARMLAEQTPALALRCCGAMAHRRWAGQCRIGRLKRCPQERVFAPVGYLAAPKRRFGSGRTGEPGRCSRGGSSRTRRDVAGG